MPGASTIAQCASYRVRLALHDAKERLRGARRAASALFPVFERSLTHGLVLSYSAASGEGDGRPKSPQKGISTLTAFGAPWRGRRQQFDRGSSHMCLNDD